MTLLVISPDYASHLYPLATLATAWRDAGERVVVATGPATHDLVEGFGYTRTELRLGRGSNPGVIRAEDQPRGEDDALRGFFDATRRGAVATLAFQARARRSDLLWDPVGSARAVHRVVDEVRPDHVVVDHLAFSARIALTAAGIPHADVVLGHPTALTVGDEVYGCPPAFPRAVQPAPEDLAELRRLCEEVRDDFTDQWNAALAVLAPQAPPSRDAFAETGDVLLLNYPGELHPPARTAALPAHAFLGSAVRSEPHDAEVAQWLERSDQPVVYVSLGSFLSVRRAGPGGGGPATPRRAGRPGERRHPALRARPRAHVLAGAAGAAAGDGARPGRAGGVPRRQQQRHRGADRRGPAAAPPAVDRPVRRRRGARGCRSRRGAGPQLRVTGRDPGCRHAAPRPRRASAGSTGPPERRAGP